MALLKLLFSPHESDPRRGKALQILREGQLLNFEELNKVFEAAGKAPLKRPLKGISISWDTLLSIVDQGDKSWITPTLICQNHRDAMGQLVDKEDSCLEHSTAIFLLEAHPNLEEIAGIRAEEVKKLGPMSYLERLRAARHQGLPDRP